MKKINTQSNHLIKNSLTKMDDVYLFVENTSKKIEGLNQNVTIITNLLLKELMKYQNKLIC